MDEWGIVQVVASWTGQYQIQTRCEMQKFEWYWLITGIGHQACDGHF